MAKFASQNSLTLGSYGPFFFPQKLKLSKKEAQSHFHVIGISGSGKSRFLAGLYLALLRAGLSATLVDPHGDLARLVLAHLVEKGYFQDQSAYQKLLYLDIPTASRQKRYLPFNVLSQPGSPHTIASNIMEAMHRAWPSLASGHAPMFDTLIQTGVKVLISNNLPLPALYRFLVEKDFRDQLLKEEPDQDIVSVYHDWYDRLPTRDQLDVSGSTLRRVGLLIFDPVLKYSLAQPGNTLSFRELLDQGRSAIINLALDNGEARRLFGSLITVSAEQGALSRAELKAEQRYGSHHLIIDEFSEFTAQSEEALSRMLSLTRKYGLFLVMAHQTWSQASERLRGALQNVGVEVIFRLGRPDAEYTAPYLAKIDPRSVSTSEEDERVSVGMREQWESWVQAIQQLKPRQAFINPPGIQVKTMEVADPKVQEKLLAWIEGYYLEHCFRSQQQVEQDLACYRAPVESVQPSRSVPRSGV